ncbi:MAG: hypothetical protein ACR2NM_09355 [Bythopirellula sp.]
MLRTLILLIGVSAVGFLFDVEPAQARRWSPGNPGIYGNVHGVTYRSMKYERDHGNRRPMFRRSRGRFFRRW